jgi:hypothetical protein
VSFEAFWRQPSETSTRVSAPEGRHRNAALKAQKRIQEVIKEWKKQFLEVCLPSRVQFEDARLFPTALRSGKLTFTLLHSVPANSVCERSDNRHLDLKVPVM